MKGDKDRGRGQGHRRRNSWQAIAVIQVRDGSGLDLGDNTGDGEEWSESGYIVKVEQKGLPVGWMRCEIERGVKEDPKKSGLSNQKVGMDIYSGGENQGRIRYG